MSSETPTLMALKLTASHLFQGRFPSFWDNRGGYIPTQTPKAVVPLPVLPPQSIQPFMVIPSRWESLSWSKPFSPLDICGAIRPFLTSTLCVGAKNSQVTIVNGQMTENKTQHIYWLITFKRPFPIQKSLPTSALYS